MTANDLNLALSKLDAGFRRLKGIGDTGANSDEISFDEWDWEVGVGLYGAFRQAEAAGDIVARERIGRWYDRQIRRRLPRRQVNSTAPMLTLALLAQVSGREDWRIACADWANWMATRMLRTEEGGIQHTVKERDNDGELWDDTLVMAALFMAAAGKLCGRQDWIEDAEAQFLTHIRFLGDPKSGLFFHGWTFDGRHNFANALWCRGNAWLTMAIPELYRINPPSGAVDRHLRAVWNTQVAALLPLQNPCGLWHTLLDDPDSPLEASGSAGIAYGMLAGMRENLVSFDMWTAIQKPVARAHRAIATRIGPDGLLEDVSDGTPMGHDLDFYRRIPNVPTPYGQALATLFLSELAMQDVGVLQATNQ